jgi:serine/threonine protein kinase/tetratricopeptide (TPR) repeat protein
MTATLKSPRSIFLQAVENHSPDEWPKFLDSACGGDQAVRDQVARLLGAHARLDGFMAHPAAPVAERPTGDWSGQTIGRYKLLEQIGEGGMGVVYVAEQTRPVRRRVALKIIKPGMDSRQIIARFEAERQALAMMDHPNIARILDAGTVGEGDRGQGTGGSEQAANLSPATCPLSPDSARPFFVMELVLGLPITEFCDHQQLNVRQRLALFVTVCHAVHHAHQKGILHRDLKPNNVLVTAADGQPVVKVIDFGLAKALSPLPLGDEGTPRSVGEGVCLTERTLHTGFAQLMGTPLYMSPEQAELGARDIDTRSDVYSLGVMLYELLTGATPFDKDRLRAAGFDEMRRIIREEEPPRPSRRLSTLGGLHNSTIAGQRGLVPRRLVQHLHGELDWIVMKTLDKDRDRRYQSASQLAEDVERYLHDEPVEASPPSVTYRLTKFVRRNKWPTMAVGLLVGGLVVATVLALLLAARERELAVRQHELSQRGQLVQEEISAALTKVARLRSRPQADLAGSRSALAQAREETQRALALAEAGPSPPGVEAQVRELLAELDQELADGEFMDILNEAWIAQAATDPRNARWAPEKCVPILTRALKSRGIEVGSASPAETAAVIRSMPKTMREGMLVSISEWARCRSVELGARIRRVVDNEPAGPAYRLQSFDRIRGLQLGRDAPMEPTKPTMSLTPLGRYLSPLPGNVVRLQVIRGGQSTAPELFEVVVDPTQAWLQAVACEADTDPWRRQMREALDITDKAERLQSLRGLAESADLTRQPVRVLTLLADMLISNEGIEPALALLRRVQHEFPDDVHANTTLSAALSKASPPQPEESVRYLTAAIALCPTSACSHVNLGVALSKLDRPAEALRQYREALRVQPDFLLPAQNIFILLKQQGRTDEALAELRAFIDRNPLHARARYGLGTELMNLGKLEDAVVELTMAAQLEPNLSPIRINLASAFRQLGRLDEAIQQYREQSRIMPAEAIGPIEIARILSQQGKFVEAIAMLREVAKRHPNDARAHNNLAWNLVTAPDPAIRQPDEALLHVKRSLELAARAAPTWNTLGLVHYRRGEWPQAASALQKSEELQSGGQIHNWLLLAMVHWRLSQKELARQFYDKSAAWLKGHPANEEIARYWAEANELLAIADPQPLLDISRQPKPSIRAAEQSKPPSSMIQLGMFYLDQGQYAQAQPLLEDALETLRRTLGEDHVDTLMAMNGLGKLYWQTGKLDQAILLGQSALEGLKTRFGSDPKTLTVMNNLALWYAAAGQLDRALPLMEEALQGRRQKLGPDDPATIGTMSNLAALYRKSDDCARAAELYRDALARAQRVIGAEHPQSLRTMSALGRVLMQLKEYSEAESLLRECLAASERIQPDRWSTFNTRSLLGAALVGQAREWKVTDAAAADKKLAEAEPLLLAGYEGVKARESLLPFDAKTALPESLQRLIDFYTQWDKPDDAARWQRELAARTASQSTPKPAAASSSAALDGQ